MTLILGTIVPRMIPIHKIKMENLEELRVKINSCTKRITRNINQGVGAAKAGNRGLALECIKNVIRECEALQEANLEVQAFIDANVVKSEPDNQILDYF